MSGMRLSASTQCVKYLLFIFNLLFLISGIIFLGVGFAILRYYYTYPHFLDDRFFTIPSLLIAIGFIIFIIAFFGCCGAVRENYCMIVTFTTLLVLIFLLELSGGISGYVLRNEATEVVGDNLLTTMKEYNKTEEIREVWDDLQNGLDCCGTNNYTDWKTVPGLDSLPTSCCFKAGETINLTCTAESSNLHHEGCLLKLIGNVKGNALWLGGVGLGIAFVQVIGIWFSIFLARSIRNTYETV